MAKKPTAPMIQYAGFKRPERSSTDAEYLKQLDDSFLEHEDIDKALTRFLQYYRGVLAPYLKDDDEGDYMFDMGAGWRRFSLVGELTPEVVDAARGMDIFYLLQKHLGNKTVSRRLSSIIECAFQWGVLSVIVPTRQQIEPLAIKGANAHEGQKRGGSHAKLSDEEKGRAKVHFMRLKDGGSTNNDAVLKVLRDINSGRKEQVGKTTVERAVGIRKVSHK